LIKKLSIDGRDYEVEVRQQVFLSPDAPRLVVVSRQQNPTTTELVRVCIEAVRHFTPEPHELWVVDNNSPLENVSWLMEWPGINVALNRTEPLPPQARCSEPADVNPNSQLLHDSYANAVALETAIRLIDPQSQYVMSMHMDTMPCMSGWLSFLTSKIRSKVRAAGVRMDRTRTPEGVLHVLGYMVDFQLFKNLHLDYLPDLPDMDVGDRVTRKLREEGYEVFACPNTLWEPHLETHIAESSPLREFHVDRSFDDDGNVIFLHLGRGVRKSIGEHRRGTGAEDWIQMAREYLLV
jgi:hypothetical protein